MVICKYLLNEKFKLNKSRKFTPILGTHMFKKHSLHKVHKVNACGEVMSVCQYVCPSLKLLNRF